MSEKLTMEESGFLIERSIGGCPVWLCVKLEQFDWTPDSLQAIRFCRREDADQLAALIGDDAELITEHSWGPMPAARQHAREGEGLPDDLDSVASLMEQGAAVPIPLGQRAAKEIRSLTAEVSQLRERLICEDCDGPVNAPSDAPTTFGCCHVCRGELVKKAADLTAEVARLNGERDRLKTRLLSAAGDDLCRLTQEEIKAYTSGKVQIPPREEFIPSCERFHEQMASEAGVLKNCLTLAQLIAENEQLQTENDENGRLAIVHREQVSRLTTQLAERERECGEVSEVLELTLRTENMSESVRGAITGSVNVLKALGIPAAEGGERE